MRVERANEIRRKRGARLGNFIGSHQHSGRATSHLRPCSASVREVILQDDERFTGDIARDVSSIAWPAFVVCKVSVLFSK